MMNTMAQRDYYDILGVSRTASAEEIRKAHRKLVRQYHPDANSKDPAAAKKFQEVQEAYDVLSDPEKRKQYDEFGHNGPRMRTQSAYGWNEPHVYVEDIDPHDFGSGGQFNDLFDQIFGNRGPFGRQGRRRSAAPTPSDVEYPYTLSFEQAARGTTVDVQVNRGGRNQTVSVRIPAGVKTGSRVRVRGGAGGGDLYIVVNVADHPYFRRDGLDVLLDVPISLYEAVLGAEVRVPTVDGHETIAVPAGVNSGTKLRIRGRGIRQGDTTGDQFCIIKIVVPKNLSEADKELIRSLQRKYPIDARADVRW